MRTGKGRALTPGRFAPAYSLLLLAGALLAAAAYAGILQLQAIPIIADRFDDKVSQGRIEALKVALTTVGGLAAASGLYVAYRRQRTEEANSGREQDKVFTERFGAAANLLSSDGVAVRLAGIESLTRLADDSDRDEFTCLSMLCAYLRVPVERLSGTARNSSADLASGGRSDWVDPTEWEVRRTAGRQVFDRLQRLSKYGGEVDLEGATVVDVSLRGGILGDVAVNLRECSFMTDCHIEDLLCRSVDFSFSRFYGSFFLGGNEEQGLITLNGSRFDGNVTVALGSTSRSPRFRGCQFEQGFSFLWNLTRYYEPSRRVGDISTTRTLDLRDSMFAGSVTIPDHGIDIRGADLSQVESLRISRYDESFGPSLRPVIRDSRTKFPDGFDYSFD